MGCQDGVVEICYFPITRTKDVRDMAAQTGCAAGVRAPTVTRPCGHPAPLRRREPGVTHDAVRAT
jgi:hypothetical protein